MFQLQQIIHLIFIPSVAKEAPERIGIVFQNYSNLHCVVRILKLAQA
jgi:hypothetical protein